MSDLRATYLIECFKNARSELLFRVTQRDRWLKLQLLAQAVLLGLAGGIKMGGVEAQQPMPPVLSLALLISVAFATLYFAEDALIVNLAEYAAQVGQSHPALRDVVNWDASTSRKRVATGFRFKTKAIALFAVFVGAPAALIFERFLAIWPWDRLGWIELVLDALLTLYLVAVVLRSLQLRNRSVLASAPIVAPVHAPVVEHPAIASIPKPQN
jgi:hypothetical protein